MTISRFPIDISFNCHRQSLSCRRESLQDEDGSINDSPSNVKESLLSRISSGRNRQVMDTKTDTLFTAFPVELRVEVFLQFCGMYCPIGKDTEGPVLLLQVCRAWKELALQTPQLWTSFALDFRPFPGPKKSEFLISALKGWIDRSRNLPLSFKLRYPGPVSDATCTNLIQCILPSSARWRDVSLTVPSTSLLPLWEVKPNSFPSLRTLSMETAGRCPFVLKNLGINWAQITELNLALITFPTLDECLYILQEGPNLKRCSMDAICVFTSNDTKRFPLPKLEHLQLTAYGGDNGGFLPGRPETQFIAFLAALSLPGLESLKIGWGVTRGPDQSYYWSDSHTTGFVDFLEGLGGHLKTLRLECLPFNAQQVLRCLEVVPCLRHLDFSMSQADWAHDFINDELLGALTQQPGRPEVLPLLQDIRLESHGESFSNPALLRFVASRWKYQASTSGHLEGVVLFSPRRRAEYRPQRFKDLKEGKLDVAARLKSEFKMVEVLSSFLNRDSYGKMICFLNGDFPSDIRPLLICGYW